MAFGSFKKRDNDPVQCSNLLEIRGYPNLFVKQRKVQPLLVSNKFNAYTRYQSKCKNQQVERRVDSRHGVEDLTGSIKTS